MQVENNGDVAVENVYPKQTSDGFYFEDETNETMSIESQKYENGKEVRRVTLSDGRIAMLRQLTGSEMGVLLPRLVGSNKDNYQFAMVAVATQINQEGKTLEEIKDMLGKDYIKLQVANAQINF